MTFCPYFIGIVHEEFQWCRLNDMMIMRIENNIWLFRWRKSFFQNDTERATKPKLKIEPWTTTISTTELIKLNMEPQKMWYYMPELSALDCLTSTVYYNSLILKILIFIFRFLFPLSVYYVLSTSSHSSYLIA